MIEVSSEQIDRVSVLAFEYRCAVLGADGRWYRVCVVCDALIPQGGTLPRWLRFGYGCERDAATGARDHARQMARNRAADRRYREWRTEINAAARTGDWERFAVAYNDSPWGRFNVANIREDLTHDEVMAMWIK